MTNPACCRHQLQFKKKTFRGNKGLWAKPQILLTSTEQTPIGTYLLETLLVAQSKWRKPSVFQGLFSCVRISFVLFCSFTHRPLSPALWGELLYWVHKALVHLIVNSISKYMFYIKIWLGVFSFPVANILQYHRPRVCIHVNEQVNTDICRNIGNINRMLKQINWKVHFLASFE